MSEESDLEKTEEASPRRLEKAREDGDVARSRELVTLVILGAGISGLWLTSGSLGTTFGGALQHGLQFDRKSAFDASHMLTQAGSMVLEGLLAIAPFFGRVAWRGKSFRVAAGTRLYADRQTSRPELLTWE